jgi:hypothetical protein
MPSFSVSSIAAISEMDAIPGIAKAISTDAAFEYAEVIRVEQSVGIDPGKAWIVIRNVASVDEAAGSIILNDGSVISEKTLKYYSRVRITARGDTVFVGSLYKRRENIQAQSVTFEYWDDRYLLQKIPLRGALVYDSEAATVKWLTRYSPHFNPNGMRNCTQVGAAELGIAGFSGSAYVFTELAEQGDAATSPYQLIGNESNRSAGVALFWTPDRVCSYLRLFASIDLSNDNPFHARAGQPRLDSTKLLWPEFTFSGSGDEDDFCKSKVGDMNFTGKTVLNAIVQALTVTGEYDLGVQYDGGEIPSLIAVATSSLSANKKELTLQISGAASGMDKIYDGVVETNAADVCTGVAVDGQPPLIESEFQYTQADSVHNITGDSSDHLFPAWTGDEEYFFMRIIVKGEDAFGRRIKNSDGTLLATYSTAALQMARITYPKVFRAFHLRGSNLDTILDGVNGALQGFERITSFKALWDRQLQPYFEEESGVNKVRRGRIRLDIRVQLTSVQASSNGIYHDVPFNNGLRITDDGLIWFDGLTDDIGIDNIYTGLLRNTALTDPALLSHSAYPKLKRIKLNAAIYHDTRVSNSEALGVFNPHKVAAVLDESVLPSHGNGEGTLLGYVLNPEGFREEHQVNSSPCHTNAFLVANGGGNDNAVIGLATPVNHVLHSDAEELRKYAKRKLKDMSKLKKSFKFDLIGIRPDILAGDYIQKVLVTPSGAEFPVNGVADKVVHDFETQKTSVIGSGGVE